MSTEYEIRVPRWDEFQHYKDRNVLWIKVYTRLLSDDNFLRLTWPQRGILATIWLEYARANAHRPPSEHRAISGSTTALTRRFGGRITSAQLEALNHAGFIEVSASSTLAARYQSASAEEKREEQELPREGAKVVPLRPANAEEHPDDLQTLGESGALDEFFADLEQRRMKGTA